MLTYEQIKNYYQDGTDKKISKALIVEYLQYELLDSIFQQKSSRYLSFIGGTAIRIVYNSDRFSEDLDFDNFGLEFSVFKQLIEAVTQDMGNKGFSVDFRLVEKNAFHCYIKFRDIIHNINLSQTPAEKILIRIDTQRKNKLFEPVLFTLNKFDVYRKILVNPIDIILAQKLIAILERKREKGRDFYDVSYLLGLTSPDFEYIEKTLKISKKLFINKLLKRCESFNYTLLAKDVAPFVTDEKHLSRVESFWSYIQQVAKKW